MCEWKFVPTKIGLRCNRYEVIGTFHIKPHSLTIEMKHTG